MVGPHQFLEEAFCCGNVTLGAQHELDRAAAESIARYRYSHSVPTFTYVSSNRKEVPFIFRCGRIRLLISGA
jgi:hypothetical protein